MAHDPDWEHWLAGLKAMELGHITVTEASEKLGLAPRAGYLTRLCRKGKIPEAYLSSGVWLIPVRWVLSEGQKKGIYSPHTGPLSLRSSPVRSTKNEKNNNSKGNIRIQENIDDLLLEMEKLVEQMEGASPADQQGGL